MQKTEQIRAVVYQDGNTWIAQGLELDICASSRDLSKLYDRFQLLVQLERQHSEQAGLPAFHGIEPAPKHFHDMWEQHQSGFSQEQDHVALRLCA